MNHIVIRYPNAPLLTSDLLPAEMRTPSAAALDITPNTLSEEENVIHASLKKYGSTVSGKQHLASEFGINIATLYHKIKKYNL